MQYVTCFKFCVTFCIVFLACTDITQYFCSRKFAKC